jgi:catechol 2,3-dioxygenase-like lactoylglutathione lyase family enzyme|tara:strand:- start:775 stop:1365 length:591 start_codon:yes stop_codon:yes gene_type:complete
MATVRQDCETEAMGGAQEPNTPDWRGVHHLAMVTPDMDATVRFYVGVLGMPLVATLRAGPMRHYFFELGPGNTIAFFEVTGAETFSKPAGAPSARAIQFDHVSFGLHDEAALIALQQRLVAADCEVTRVVDHSILRSIYFHDPNGIALEASWWTIDEQALSFEPDDPQLFADPDPVPAVAELAGGGLQSTPTTRLR